MTHFSSSRGSMMPESHPPGVSSANSHHDYHQQLPNITSSSATIPKIHTTTPSRQEPLIHAIYQFLFCSNWYQQQQQLQKQRQQASRMESNRGGGGGGGDAADDATTMTQSQLHQHYMAQIKQQHSGAPLSPYQHQDHSRDTSPISPPSMKDATATYTRNHQQNQQHHVRQQHPLTPAFLHAFNRQTFASGDQRRLHLDSWDAIFILKPSFHKLLQILGNQIDERECLRRRRVFSMLITELMLLLQRFLSYKEQEEESSSSTTAHDTTNEQQQTRLHSRDIRVANAVDTLAIILLVLYQKKWQNRTIDLLTIITGGNLNNSDAFFDQLIHVIVKLLNLPQVHVPTKQRLLLLLLTFVAGHLNLNQNAIIDYFNVSDAGLYEALVSLLLEKKIASSPNSRQRVLTILILLANYRKYEAQNIYLNNIRQENNAKVLFYLAEAVTEGMSSWVRTYRSQNEKDLVLTTFEYNQNASESGASSSRTSHSAASMPQFQWLSTSNSFSISNFFQSSVQYVSQTILPGGGGDTESNLSPDQATLHTIMPSLLMMYELIHSNTHFVKILVGSLSKIARKEELKGGGSGNTSSATENTASPIEKAIPNILKEFISLSSILFQKTRSYDAAVPHHCHLIIIIWICLLEHKLFQEYIFDMDISLKVDVYHKEKAKYYVHQYNGTGCMARILFELMLQYTLHQSRRESFPVRQMRKAFAIIHAIIGSAIERNIRLDVDYLTLVRVCMRSLQICTQLKHFHLVLQILRLVNLLLLCGDEYAASESVYHDIIYELWRNRKPLDELSAYIASPDLKKDIRSHSKLSATAFEQLITNPMQMVEYLSDMLAGTRFPTQAQAVKLIQEHANDMPIVSIRHIEQIQLSYLENPNNVPFFSQYLKLFSKKARKSVLRSFSGEGSSGL